MIGTRRIKTLTWAAGAALCLTVGCTGSDASLPNSDSGPTPDSTTAPPTDGPAAGTYPKGPYGCKTGDIFADIRLQALADPKHFCKAAKDRTIDKSKLTWMTLGQWHTLKSQCPGGTASDHKLLWVMAGAGWCQPCQKELTAASNAIKNGKWFKEVDVVSVLFEDNKRQPPTQTYASAGWSQFSPSNSIPIMLDPKSDLAKRCFDRSAVPFNMILELSTMKILLAKTGYDPAKITSTINAYLKK